MADDHGDGDAPAAPKKKLDPQLLLVLGNTVFVLAALGALIYTKLIFERPPIVEETEIKRQEEEIKKPEAPAEKVIVPFDEVVINAGMTGGKSHFATIAWAVECKDSEIAGIVGVKKAMLADKLVSAVGRRQMTELNTIQGKLLLKTELLREFNTLVPPGGITDLFFSNFILQ